MKKLPDLAIAPLYGTAFAVVAFGLVRWTGPELHTETALYISGMMGFIYGFLMFATITIPKTRPRNDGWRKFRPLMWFAAWFGFFWSLSPITSFGDLVAIIFMSGFPTLCGWGMLQLRVERYDFLNRSEQANA
jgi:hypothetical protein